MKLLTRSLLALPVLVAGAMVWGYWHASSHTALDFQVHDYGLAAKNLAYDSPHHATLELFDAKRTPLAVAKSLEPYGYLSAQHPTLGDCSSLQGVGGDAYASCYSRYSRWASEWAARARTATFKLGSCVLADVPVTMSRSKTGWASWWTPLPHVGGTPFEYVQLAVDVNSRSCSIIPAGH